jgi:hypothetical protein
MPDKEQLPERIEVYVQDRELPATTRATRPQLEAMALRLSDEDCLRVHAGLQRLAAVCDGAQERDTVGFSGTDVRIGHYLAALPVLTPLQAALGSIVLRKYRTSQLSELELDDLYERLAA